MGILRFEDSVAWCKAKELTIQLYKLFQDSKDFGFRDQILRATISIMNNIAEGFERRGNKEFKHFLYIAKGSAGEVRSMLIIAEEVGYLSKDDYREMSNLSEEISRIIAGLIKSIN